MRPLTLAPPQLENTGSVTVHVGLVAPWASEIFLDQGSNPCLLHWQAGSLPLSHQGSPPPPHLRLSRQPSATSSPQALVWTKPCPIQHPPARSLQVARTLVTHCRDCCGCFPNPVLPDNLLLGECLRASPKGFTGLVFLKGPHAWESPANLLRLLFCGSGAGPGILRF